MVGYKMNGKDFDVIMKSIHKELSEPNGVFQRYFGKKTEEELEEMKMVAGIALMAADRYYSRQTELEFEIRVKNEHV